MWHRRAFLRAAGAGFAASLLPQSAEALENAELLFATATQETPGKFGARVLTETGKLITAIELPVRGHDVTYSPVAGRAVVFARQPGMFAVAFDPVGRQPSITIPSIEGRHFFGHGTFSPDGTLLYATENDFANARGVLGIYDVRAGFVRIGEFPTYGMGPHEALLMPDGQSFAIANGGIETHPDYGRSELNLDTMAPSLTFVSTRDGSLIGTLTLPAELHQLSIRHLVVDARNRVWFGCQFRGDRGSRPQLIGCATADGDIRLIELPAATLGSLGNYVGGLAISFDRETIAATSPIGGSIVTIDAATGAPLSLTPMAHTCGAAPDGSGFLATNGSGELQGLGGSPVARQQFGFEFDEHLRVLAGAA